MSNPEFWIESNEAIGLSIEDMKRHVGVVRVFQECKPFAYGQVVAFFVGNDAINISASVFASLPTKNANVRKDENGVEWEYQPDQASWTNDKGDCQPYAPKY